MTLNPSTGFLAMFSVPYTCYIFDLSTLSLFYFIFFLSFPISLTKVALSGKYRFIFPKVLRGWLADLTPWVSAALNERMQITVNPYLHIINTKIQTRR